LLHVYIVVVGGVNHGSCSDLLQIGKISGLLRGNFCLSENGEKDGSKNSNDRNNDQKLNQGKGFLHLVLAKGVFDPA
jgi:hypothetical protein